MDGGSGDMKLSDGDQIIHADDRINSRVSTSSNVPQQEPNLAQGDNVLPIESKHQNEEGTPKCDADQENDLVKEKPTVDSNRTNLVEEELVLLNKDTEIPNIDPHHVLEDNQGTQATKHEPDEVKMEAPPLNQIDQDTRDIISPKEDDNLVSIEPKVVAEEKSDFVQENHSQVELAVSKQVEQNACSSVMENLSTDRCEPSNTNLDTFKEEFIKQDKEQSDHLLNVTQQTVEVVDKTSSRPSCTEQEVLSSEKEGQAPPGSDNNVSIISESKSKEVDSKSVPHNPAIGKETNNPSLSSSTVPVFSTNNLKLEAEKKKDDEKLAMYKALAIKLKKDLVKNREELKKLREDSQQETSNLKERLDSLDATLLSERQSNSQTITALELKTKDLKQQLIDSEEELQSLQSDFENYKIKASQIMKQNGVTISSTSKSFEEERYKQLKELNEVQSRQISNLESQLSTTLNKNQDLTREIKLLQDQSDDLKKRFESYKSLETKCEALTKENENLKAAIKQFRIKLNEPAVIIKTREESEVALDSRDNLREDQNRIQEGKEVITKTYASNIDKLDIDKSQEETSSNRLSPSTSMKDGYQTNSSSSFDGSTSGGYVHIKQGAFEIINRGTLTEDGQNDIETLKKAYLDSENTNSLLTDQVKALKEEIRRLQRGTDRLDLAENLEYLKNIVYKFVSLDSSQSEQKQRLVPVLSTVLKLSPEETAKLNSVAILDKPSLTSSFFKL